MLSVTNISLHVTQLEHLMANEDSVPNAQTDETTDAADQNAVAVGEEIPEDALDQTDGGVNLGDYVKLPGYQNQNRPRTVPGA